MYSAIVINKLKSHFITVQNFAKMLKRILLMRVVVDLCSWHLEWWRQEKLGNEDILDCVKPCLLEIFFCCLNMKREIKFGQVHAMTKASFSALLKWPLNCLSTPVLTFFFLFVLCVGAYEGSGQVRVGPTNCVQRKKFKRLVTCTCIILPAPNSPIFCLCLDQKLMWTSYFCVASNLELHLALYVSCLNGLSPQIEPKILGWFLSRQPHPYLEGMLWLPAKAVLWKTHYSFSEVVFTG